MIRCEIRSVGRVYLVGLALWNYSIPVPLDHRDGSAREIPPRVCKIGIVSVLEAPPRKTSVRIERYFSEQKVSERIDAEPVYRFVDVERDPSGFAESITGK